MTGWTTRRELVGSAMLAAASGRALSGAVAAEAAARITDADVLRRALRVEQLVVIAYRRALASGTLTPGQPTVPWVVWEEDIGGGRHAIFVSRLVGGDHFQTQDQVAAVLFWRQD